MVKVKKVIFPKIRRLAKKAGVELQNSNDNVNYSFDGKSITIYNFDGKRRSNSNIIHDICHYIVAPKPRKNKPEYGLGPSPDTIGYYGKRLVSYTAAQKEEEMASCLGIYYEKKLGLKWKATYRLHNWGNKPKDWRDTSDLFKETLLKLKKKRYIK